MTPADHAFWSWTSRAAAYRTQTLRRNARRRCGRDRPRRWPRAPGPASTGSLISGIDRFRWSRRRRRPARGRGKGLRRDAAGPLRDIGAESATVRKHRACHPASPCSSRARSVLSQAIADDAQKSGAHDAARAVDRHPHELAESRCPAPARRRAAPRQDHDQREIHWSRQFWRSNSRQPRSRPGGLSHNSNASSDTSSASSAANPTQVFSFGYQLSSAMSAA